MVDWPIYKLEEVCSKITDGAHGSPKEKPTGFPMASVKDMTRHGIELKTCKLIGEGDFKQLQKQGCQPFLGDVLIAKDGNSCLDTVCVYKQNEEIVLLSSIAILRPNSKVLSEYLKYYLESPTTRALLKKGYRSGSAIPRVVLKDFCCAPIIVPPLEIQQSISKILGSLDDKIELNRQMSETLEAIARAIFQSWFVDFDPVRAKAEGCDTGLPPEVAALFPDGFEVVDGREVPSGWELKEIRDETLNIQYGLTQSASQEEIGPKFLRITDIQGGKIDWDHVPYCAVSPEEFEKYRINVGDIFVARTGASTGENIYIIDAPNSVFASYLVRFQFKVPAMGRVVGEFMRTESYFDFVSTAIGGSAQPNASAQVLASVQFVFPTPEIAEAFAKVVAPLDKMRAINERQSRTLTQIRDALLPKLMSGEILVKDTEIEAHA